MGATWQLPGYQVLELVGFGGSGEVWRARSETSDEVVALKRLHSTDAIARERVRREAAILSSVAGAHVVRVRDLVITTTDAVLVMDYAEGGNLATILAVRGELAGPEVVTLVAPLAGALADAHDRGIVHGDVTPANIVFAADGRPLLTDFGVARAVGTVAAEVEVTAPYVAPEVLTGAPASAAADVYSLCRVAADALARASAPPALLAAIEAGLAEDPHDRPGARRLAGDVLRACAAAPVRLVRSSAAPPPAVTTTVRVDRPVVSADHSPSTTTTRRRGARRRASRRRWARLRPPRRLAVALVSTAALFLAVAGGVMWGHRSQSSAAVLPQAPAAGRPAALDWLAIVQRLESARARAVASADMTTLRDVYVAGSPALAADLALVRRLVAWHQHATGFTMSALRVAVLASTPAEATLRVTDQVSAYTLAGGRGVQHQPATSPRTLTMVLRRVDGSWRIAVVRVDPHI